MTRVFATTGAQLMASDDVLLSNAFNVMLEFLILNGSLVLISNSDRFNDQTHFDAAVYELTCRDMGDEIHDAKLIGEAVGSALDSRMNVTSCGCYTANTCLAL